MEVLQCRFHHSKGTICITKGTTVQAQAENIFLETPALMIFFINRVTYANSQLKKDNRVFDFEDSILVGKSQPS